MRVLSAIAQGHLLHGILHEPDRIGRARCLRPAAVAGHQGARRSAPPLPEDRRAAGATGIPRPAVRLLRPRRFGGRTLGAPPRRHVQLHPGRPLRRRHDRRDGLDADATRHPAIRRIRPVRGLDQRARDGRGRFANRVPAGHGPADGPGGRPGELGRSPDAAATRVAPRSPTPGSSHDPKSLRRFLSGQVELPGHLESHQAMASRTSATPESRVGRPGRKPIARIRVLRRRSWPCSSQRGR